MGHADRLNDRLYVFTRYQRHAVFRPCNRAGRGGVASLLMAGGVRSSALPHPATCPRLNVSAVRESKSRAKQRRLAMCLVQ